MRPDVYKHVLREFDLPAKVDAICHQLGGVRGPEDDGATWIVKTIHGDLRVWSEPGAIVCEFDEPSRAYAKLLDVRYPTGRWPFEPRTRLSTLGPTEAVQALSELIARFASRLRRIVLTTDVVSETNDPVLRTPK